jgi:hypothetical protein
MLVAIGFISGVLVIMTVMAILLGKAVTERDEVKNELVSVRETCKDVITDLARAKEDVLMWKRGLEKVGSKDKTMLEENIKLKVENAELKETIDKLNEFDRNDILDLEK